jgi:Flp pilus assembly protein TadG
MGTLRNRNRSRWPFISRLFRKTRAEKGQALVELALSFPILVILFVGAAEFARVVYASIEVSNAAMAGVSYGAQNPSTAGDTTGIQNAVSNDALDLTLGTTSVSKSCICSDGSASTCLPTDCSTSNIETILTVQTQATIDPGVHLPGFSTTYTLHGRAVQKVLQ